MNISSIIARDLQALLDKSKLVTMNRKKSGLIDTKRLSKYSITPHVFRKRFKREEGIDCAITLLVDASGSMSGTKSLIVADLLGPVQEAFENVKGVTYSIAAFNSLYVELKGFENDKRDHKQMRKEYLSLVEDVRASTVLDGNILTFQPGRVKGAITCDNAAGYNSDAYAVTKAVQALEQIDCPTKLLIVFSDGQPTNWYAVEIARQEHNILTRGSEKKSKMLVDGDKLLTERSNPHNAHKELEKAVIHAEKSHVKVASIGICTTSVSEFYKFYKIINDPHALPDALRSVLSSIYSK